MSLEIIEVKDLIKNYMNEEFVKGYFATVPPTAKQLKKLDNETEKAKYALKRTLERFPKEMALNVEIEQLGNGRFHTSIVSPNYPHGCKTGYSSLNQKSIWTILDKLDLILSFNAQSDFYKKEANKENQI